MADARESLRRIRSAGDIPVSSAIIQSPAPVLFQPSRYSESHVHSPDPNLPIHDASSILNAITVPPAMPRGPQSAGLVIERMRSPAPPIPEHSEVPVRLPVPPPPPLAAHNVSSYSRIMTFFGYGRGASRARKLLVSLWYNLAWGFVQVRRMCFRDQRQG